VGWHVLGGAHLVGLEPFQQLIAAVEGTHVTAKEFVL
jgi:hypothetical protein